MKIDRMILADKFTPQAIAASIIHQIEEVKLPIPINEIAYSVGIKEILEEDLDKMEGGLSYNTGKTTGAILINCKSMEERKRFTIGHELGHFLILDHYPEKAGQFLCTSEDMKEKDTSQDAKRMETEANVFAASLLMPTSLFRKQVKKMGGPLIENIFSLAEKFKTSKEATANRYTNIIDRPCSVIFSKDDVIRYAITNESFAWLKFSKGNSLPNHMMAVNRHENIEEASEVQEQKGYIWCDGKAEQPCPEFIFEQTMAQQNGYRMTLLHYENSKYDDEECEEEINEEREIIDSWKIGF
jgi:Zn-dependent peptidase ImmA (M78 family)